MRVVTGEEMRQIDRYTIEQIGLGEEVLMENAGKAIYEYIQSSLRFSDLIAVLIGSGNNGGDGFVIARYLKEAGYDVEVWLIPDAKSIRGAAKYHMDVYTSIGYEFMQVDKSFRGKLQNYTVIIDSLLGTGVNGALRNPYDQIISFINEQKRAKIIAVDIPSGLSADGGSASIQAVKATETVTLQCPKLGAYLFPEREFYGDLVILPIGIPRIAIDQVASPRWIWTEERIKSSLPIREANSHKGTNGRALILAGSLQMTGAAVLTAKACHKAGAGLVNLLIPDCIHPILASQVVEATFLPCESKKGGFFFEDGKLPVDVNIYDAVAIGPGIGRESDISSVILNLLQTVQKPLLIDADGLFHLKQFLPKLKNRKEPTVLTPHTGEMARLLGCSADEVDRNRFEYAKQFATEYGVYLVLKGPYTIVTTPEGYQFINTTGNASLAKGGSGDVLTGIILAFLMQHKNLQEAVSNAVYIHGKTADLLVDHKASLYDIVASDLVSGLPLTFRSLIE